MSVKTTLWIWSPRILGIIVALAILWYGYSDFGNASPMWDQVKSFMAAFIPALLLAIGVSLGWRSPLTGGIFISFVAVVYALASLSHPMWILGVTLPLLVVGSLFLISYGLGKKQR